MCDTETSSHDSAASSGIFRGAFLAKEQLSSQVNNNAFKNIRINGALAQRVQIYAIYKPRNVVSAMSDKKLRTLVDVMCKAGVTPLPSSHIGRLDYETSGLILTTNIGSLVGAVLDSEPPLPKTYELLIAGAHPPESPQLISLEEELVFNLGSRVIQAESASVDSVSVFNSLELTFEHRFIDRDDHEVVARGLAMQRARRAEPNRSRASGELIALHVPNSGWLTRVELTIHQGRNRQIRRLCTRAGLKLLHLKRIKIGPLDLGSLLPGEVRALDGTEKAALFEWTGFRPPQ
jgi:16S rRNA U516 pseudouridylate synthase RsuA-like enzyme